MRSRKAPIFFLCTALALGLAPASVLAEPDETAALQQDLASAQSRLEELGNELISLDAELQAAVLELERTDNLIERIDQERALTEEDLDDARAELSEHLRTSYKTGSFDALEFILSAESLDDLLARFYYMEKVSRGEAESIDAVNVLAAELDGQRRELEEQQADQLERVAAIEGQVEAQQELVAEARAYYDQLDESVRRELERQAAEEAEAARAAEQEEGEDDAATPSASATAAVIEAINEPESVTTPAVPSAPAQQDTADTKDDEEKKDEESADEPSEEPAEDPQPTPEPETSEPEPEPETADTSTSDEPFPGGGVASAYSCLGWPYVYGGYLPSQGGFDCSGLVSYCYGDGTWRRGCESLAGAIMDAGLWKSSVDDLVVGDLVFTDSEFNHVMIYIGGDQCIHAPFPGRVVCITDIYSFYGGGPFVKP